MELPNITNKQKEILLLLYRFRFLNRIQIQKLLKHKDPKNINVWLKDLTNKNYTKRNFERKAGINDPAIYFISKNGIKFFRSHSGCEGEYLRKLSQESRRSGVFIRQCILIADVFLKLQNENNQSFRFYTQSDFPVNGIIRDLLPSFAYVKEKNTKIEHFTCEILREGIPRYAVRARIQKYIEFFSYSESEVCIILYCANEKLYKYVGNYSKKMLESEDVENINIKVQLFE